MSFLSNQRLVSLTPVFTMFALEGANVGQLHRMWTEHTAAGQSLVSWLMVQAALWMWFNFYRVKTPGEHFAIGATALGIVLNACVCLSVLYWRYFA